MQYISLASRYRPQTFAEVAGQDMVKAVLSRAAAEDKVAPAYLFSGTRGVGKTTIARIFAKALNCAHAPATEPCNDCEQCRKVTQGIHVDVAEIDGASNNSVEDARALREKIGYAPMEGRYKVFIIDEAHMLSRSAFNALLKTLEEPPARVVFIFATTEAHKFPVTIVSRCQHFIFRHLPESAILQHLTNVLEKEHVPFDAGAVRLIAKRAAGSVRDSMSLLDQTLALGGDRLTQESAREVLGLAGQEMFVSLLDALAAQDCAAVSLMLRRLLDQGVDIGFFLRELANIWRILFLLRQSGAKALPVLELPEDEAHVWQEQAPRFTLTHIHAAWQMVLDTQRRVIQSPEPAAALELLLLHLALLPRLLPLGNLPGSAADAGGQPLTTTPAADTPTPTSQRNTAHGDTPPIDDQATTKASLGTSTTTSQTQPEYQPHSAAQAGEQPLAAPTSGALSSVQQASAPTAAVMPCAISASAADPSHPSAALPPDLLMETPSATTGESLQSADTAATKPQQRSWTDFCAFCAQEKDQGRSMPLPINLLPHATANFTAQTCTVHAATHILGNMLEKNLDILQQLMTAYCGEAIQVSIAPPAKQIQTEAQLMESFSQREEVRQCCKVLDAKLLQCTPSK